MKKIIIAAFSLTFFFSTNASAAFILDTVVGDLDLKIGETTLSKSDEKAEEIWVESVLGFDIDYTQFSDSSSEGANWDAVWDGTSLLPGQYAFQFTSNYEPDYYLIKVGNGSGAGADNSHFLFQNNDSQNWAHVLLTDFGEDVSIFNIGIISHVGAASVPEPSVIALFAAGLIGAGFASRRRLT